VGRRRTDPEGQAGDTRDYSRQGPPLYDPYARGADDREPKRGGSGRGWMVAFLLLLALVVAAVLVWFFLLREEDEGGDVEIVPATVDFGDQDLGQRSPAVTITVDNETSEGLGIASIAIEGEHAQDFQLTDDTSCSPERQLGAGASCTIGVRFRPRAREEREAAVVVRVTGRDAPLRVQLRGTGVGEATVVLDTARLDLGRVQVGRSRTRQVTLTNVGNAPLAIEEILIDGRDASAFSLARATDCSVESRVRAGESCTIAVTFRPSEDGGHAAELAVLHDASGSPSGVELRGEGRGQAQLGLEPTTVAFGELDVGSTSGVQSVTVTNSGTATFVLAALELVGPAAAEFAIADSSTCSPDVELEPGGTCAVDLMFLPEEGGARTAALEVETRGGLAGRVDLAGTGLEEPPATTETEPTTTG
jgi:hypothetical protein